MTPTAALHLRVRQAAGAAGSLLVEGREETQLRSPWGEDDRNLTDKSNRVGVRRQAREASMASGSDQFGSDQQFRGVEVAGAQFLLSPRFRTYRPGGHPLEKAPLPRSRTRQLRCRIGPAANGIAGRETVGRRLREQLNTSRAGRRRGRTRGPR